MNESTFEITILDQGWLDDAWEVDLYSHGHIRLTVGGIAVSDETMNYGISDSALALLRTVESDHTADQPVADRLFFHGCATIPMMACPIGVNWEVRHHSGLVDLSEFVQYPSVDELNAIRFPGLRVTLPLDAYRDQVLTFARQAKSLY